MHGSLSLPIPGRGRFPAAIDPSAGLQGMALLPLLTQVVAVMLMSKRIALLLLLLLLHIPPLLTFARVLWAWGEVWARGQAAPLCDRAASHLVP